MHNPTKEETDQTLARIQADTDQVFFHDLGNHNRAIARKRIDQYHERKFYAPNHAQMQSAVKGGEQYRFHQTPLARRILRWIKNWSDRT